MDGELVTQDSNRSFCNRSFIHFLPSPLGELFGEGALFAVADIAEAEVLVNLQQRLVLPCLAEIFFAFAGIAKQAERSLVDLFAQCGRGGFLVILPGGTITIGQPARDQMVDLKILDPVFP